MLLELKLLESTADTPEEGKPSIALARGALSLEYLITHLFTTGSCASLELKHPM